MADFYGDMASVAVGVIGEFKQGTVRYIAVTKANGPADNPGAPSEVATVINAVCRGVQFRYVDGTNIVTSDGQLTMPVNAGVTPSISGFIEVDGRRHRIAQVSAIPPAGTPAAYRVIYKR